MIFPYADENPAPGRNGEIILLVVLNVLGIGFWSERDYAALGFVPADLDWYRWLTSQFLHGDIMHLAGNLWALWIFGDNVAARLGKWFLPFYLAGGIAANFLHYALNPFSRIPCIGASGAICAVIGAYVVFFPHARMRCMTWFFFKIFRYSMSALLFGAIYVAWQFLNLAAGGDAGVAYSAHLGGLFFGAALALGWGRPREAEEMGLSGPAGAGPAPGGAWESVAQALAAGQEEFAVHQYIREIRRDPYLELPEPHQLAIADKLTALGHPHLAKGALEKLILRHPLRPSAAYAHLLLGFVEQADFKDFDAAAKSYRAALAHPAAAEEAKRDAGERLAKVEAVLGRISLSEPPAPEEPCWVFLEASSLSPPQRQALAEAAGEQVLARLKNEPGVLLKEAPLAQAARLAELLEKAGVPVVILPKSRLLSLPQARLCLELSAGPAGLAFAGPWGRAQAAWKDCLLLAALSVPLAGSARKPAGLMDIPFSETRNPSRELDALMPSGPIESLEYEREGRPLPVLELVSLEPLARYRWSASPHLEDTTEDRERFFSMLQEVLLQAPNIPVNAGAQAAFSLQIPPACRFPDLGRAEAYMAWQIQLARLKKAGAYGGPSRRS